MVCDPLALTRPSVGLRWANRFLLERATEFLAAVGLSPVVPKASNLWLHTSRLPVNLSLPGLPRNGMQCLRLRVLQLQGLMLVDNSLRLLSQARHPRLHSKPTNPHQKGGKIPRITGR